jgi:hypothetical protein
LYPDFGDIYQRHVKDAKFETIRGPDFRFLKQHLALLCDLLEKNQNMGSENRTELIQALISEGDLRRARQVLPKCETNKKSGVLVGAVMSLATSIQGFLPGLKDTDEGSLRKEMERIAKGFSDSDFLLNLKSVHDEDLQPPIQEAMVLAQTQLSSSIDSAVKKMTHAVLQMQQSLCRKIVKAEIEAEERKLLGDALLAFIREINACSAGRKKS